MNMLQTLRHQQQKSLEDVASELGISWGSLYRYEHRKAIPRLDNAFKLCDYYGLTMDDLRKFFAC